MNLMTHIIIAVYFYSCGYENVLKKLHSRLLGILVNNYLSICIKLTKEDNTIWFIIKTTMERCCDTKFFNRKLGMKPSNKPRMKRKSRFMVAVVVLTIYLK